MQLQRSFLSQKLPCLHTGEGQPVPGAPLRAPAGSVPPRGQLPPSAHRRVSGRLHHVCVMLGKELSEGDTDIVVSYTPCGLYTPCWARCERQLRARGYSHSCLVSCEVYVFIVTRGINVLRCPKLDGQASVMAAWLKRNSETLHSRIITDFFFFSFKVGENSNVQGKDAMMDSPARC